MNITITGFVFIGMPLHLGFLQKRRAQKRRCIIAGYWKITILFSCHMYKQIVKLLIGVAQIVFDYSAYFDFLEK